MRITIENQDGRGEVDYTATLAGESPLKIERKLNLPSVCLATMSTAGTTANLPLRNGRVLVTADDGMLLFSGYVANEPELLFSGVGLTGPMYLAQISAVSDDVVLDRQLMAAAPPNVSQGAAQLLTTITARVNSEAGVSASESTAVVGGFTPQASQTWSENAGTLATIARAAYRVVNGQVNMSDIGTSVHVLSETDGSLSLQGLSASRTKMLVNDVTVCGEEEPQAYVTEIFQGDGTTTSFTLSDKPYAVRGHKAQLLLDQFTGPSLNPRLWTVSDPGSRFSLTASGLTVTGGNGQDGQTTVTGLDSIEMGGVLLLEVTGVQVVGACDGFVGCLYNGAVRLADLFAGFHVKQTAGGTAVTAVVKGAELGGTAPLTVGHLYSLRLRLHCRDVQRVLQSYHCVDDAGTKVFGGDLLAAGADLVVEVQDMTPGALQPAIVLYDGTVANAPASCSVIAVNSTNFFGSIAGISLKQEPAVWVTAAVAGAGATTQRLGIAAEGADARLLVGGKLTFYATSTPRNGELIHVSYRTGGRSVARMKNATSVAAEGSAGMPGTAQLICSARVPATRSSADCENAALALLDVASSRGAAWQGRYSAPNMNATGDVWPGDVLAVIAPSAGLNTKLVVRAVTVTCENCVPELLQYSIAFANDWAETLSLRVSSSIPEQVWLPPVALTAAVALPSLNSLAVTGVTTTEIDISAGVSAPAGGGFEVRRVDWRFKAGSDGDLVLRSPVPNFSVPRETPVEQYYVRMYDGAQPPNYSRFSSAVFVSVMM